MVKFLAITLLVLGVFFRFDNLDRKVYWYDEALSSLRTASYTRGELLQNFPPGKISEIKELQKFQYPHPERGFVDTLKALAADNPQHPPLYYVPARLWMQFIDNPVVAMRGWSAFLSLLAFPCIYWLCRELFDKPLIGWFSIALIAVSPFHVLYAQEARQYSLWVVITLLSSASLLYTRRVQSRLSWGIYASAIALGLYTHLLFAFVIVGHTIYLLITERLRWTKTLMSYLLASLTAFLAFTPWLALLVVNLPRLQKYSAWTAQKWSLTTMLKNWAVNLSSLFFDVQIGYSDFLYEVKLRPDDFLVYVVLLILILVGFAIYFLCRNAPKEVWLFVLILMGASALPLVLPDLLSGGGRRAGTARYLIPCYLGIQLAVTYLLSVQITVQKNWHQKFWQLTASLLIFGGVLSCAISSQAATWWNKIGDYYNPQLAATINQSPKPLLLSDNTPDSLLSLSYLLDPKVRLQLVAKPYESKVPEGFSDVFLFNPSKELQAKLRKEYGLARIDLPKELWRVEK